VRSLGAGPSGDFGFFRNGAAREGDGVAGENARGFVRKRDGGVESIRVASGTAAVFDHHDPWAVEGVDFVSPGSGPALMVREDAFRDAFGGPAEWFGKSFGNGCG